MGIERRANEYIKYAQGSRRRRYRMIDCMKLQNIYTATRLRMKIAVNWRACKMQVNEQLQHTLYLLNIEWIRLSPAIMRTARLSVNA